MKRLVVLAILAASMLGLVQAHAAGPCSTAGGTSATPHKVDPTNDWNGIATGNGSALIPYGDVYREGADITSAWISSPILIAGKTNYPVHVTLQNFAGIETNSPVYVQWTYDSGNPGVSQARRYVSFITNGRGTGTYNYGYLDKSGAVGTYTSQGTTTGGFTTGPNAEIVINAPAAKMGNPPAGATLSAFLAETRTLIGAAGTGILGVADDTTNSEGCDDITL